MNELSKEDWDALNAAVSVAAAHAQANPDCVSDINKAKIERAREVLVHIPVKRLKAYLPSRHPDAQNAQN